MKVTAIAFALAVVGSVSAAAVPGPALKGHAIPLTKKIHKEPLTKLIPGMLQATANKFGATVPQGFRPAAGFAADAVEPLNNVGNMEYYGPATIGGQTLQMLYDTGSTDVWVPDASVPSLPGNNKYSPRKSKTYKNIGDDFHIQYGSGEASGTTASETITVAGVTVKNQVFGDVTYEGEDPQASDFDGILGMGFTPIASDGATSWFENAVAQGKIANSMFSFYLNAQSTGSELYLGGYNSARYTGSISWVPLTDAGWWQFALKDITVGGRSIRPSIRQAIADTGTSLIVGPPADVTAINKAIGATYSSKYKIYTISCSKMNSAPTVAFPLNGVTLTLTGKDYIMDAGVAGLCISAFAPLAQLPVWILGDSVLRKYYSIHDMGDISNGYAGARIGFAKAT
ncbi:hypothetical protein HDU86_002660 [Geranomyces michiganensis]|nr:hypothetical protein HDU86_002660 [Geranomyces michiganensis]